MKTENQVRNKMLFISGTKHEHMKATMNPLILLVLLLVATNTLFLYNQINNNEINTYFYATIEIIALIGLALFSLFRLKYYYRPDMTITQNEIIFSRNNNFFCKEEETIKLEDIEEIELIIDIFIIHTKKGKSYELPYQDTNGNANEIKNAFNSLNIPIKEK